MYWNLQFLISSQVNATDPDSGLGGVFTYGLAAGDWPSGLFSVDPVLGKTCKFECLELSNVLSERGCSPLSAVTVAT